MTELSKMICYYWRQIVVTVNFLLCCQNMFYGWNPFSKYLSNGCIRVKFRDDNKDKVSLLLTLDIMFAFYTPLKTSENMSLFVLVFLVLSLNR